MNLLYSLKIIQDCFPTQPDHPAIIMGKKKLTLQLNISNSIHFDLERTHMNQQALQCIQKERNNVIGMFRTFEKELHPEQQWFLRMYKENNLSQSVNIKQLPFAQTQEFTFNENLLNQLIPQVEQIDQQIQNVKQAKYYHVPSEQEIKKNAEQFQAMTLTKVLLSYPKNSNSLPPNSRGSQMQPNGGNTFQSCQNIANTNANKRTN
ncbi:unnamed protein product (macronuclear) [Paramecium tetraurelia]|uniref:Uncharacterized protein n=1 Tax=Paramecium tetraurelia TaxID=5888 RepID=A0DE85_PARTE|nr:uncharacterized protein GSPATT00016194001 [Paramecium tetraurelia]CAK81352.1 unnamed protein product [Paramecium tetraurelia]|eukprot:XP_001448749.1 hypothetical protein (macronuclear) [Paramecium tetraurelia strain d4-2]